MPLDLEALLNNSGNDDKNKPSSENTDNTNTTAPTVVDETSNRATLDMSRLLGENVSEKQEFTQLEKELISTPKTPDFGASGPYVPKLSKFDSYFSDALSINEQRALNQTSGDRFVNASKDGFIQGLGMLAKTALGAPDIVTSVSNAANVIKAHAKKAVFELENGVLGKGIVTVDQFMTDSEVEQLTQEATWAKEIKAVTEWVKENQPEYYHTVANQNITNWVGYLNSVDGFSVILPSLISSAMFEGAILAGTFGTGALIGGTIRGINWALKGAAAVTRSTTPLRYAVTKGQERALATLTSSVLATQAEMGVERTEQIEELRATLRERGLNEETIQKYITDYSANMAVASVINTGLQAVSASSVLRGFNSGTRELLKKPTLLKSAGAFLKEAGLEVGEELTFEAAKEFTKGDADFLTGFAPNGYDTGEFIRHLGTAEGQQLILSTILGVTGKPALTSFARGEISRQLYNKKVDQDQRVGFWSNAYDSTILGETFTEKEKRMRQAVVLDEMTRKTASLEGAINAASDIAVMDPEAAPGPENLGTVKEGIKELKEELTMSRTLSHMRTGTHGEQLKYIDLAEKEIDNMLSSQEIREDNALYSEFLELKENMNSLKETMTLTEKAYKNAVNRYDIKDDILQDEYIKTVLVENKLQRQLAEQADVLSMFGTDAQIITSSLFEDFYSNFNETLVDGVDEGGNTKENTNSLQERLREFQATFGIKISKDNLTKISDKLSSFLFGKSSAIPSFVSEDEMNAAKYILDFYKSEITKSGERLAEDGVKDLELQKTYMTALNNISKLNQARSLRFDILTGKRLKERKEFIATVKKLMSGGQEITEADEAAQDVLFEAYYRGEALSDLGYSEWETDLYSDEFRATPGKNFKARVREMRNLVKSTPVMVDSFSSAMRYAETLEELVYIFDRMKQFNSSFGLFFTLRDKLINQFKQNLSRIGRAEAVKYFSFSLNTENLKEYFEAVGLDTLKSELSAMAIGDDAMIEEIDTLFAAIEENPSDENLQNFVNSDLIKDILEFELNRYAESKLEEGKKLIQEYSNPEDKLEASSYVVGIKDLNYSDENIPYENLLLQKDVKEVIVAIDNMLAADEPDLGIIAKAEHVKFFTERTIIRLIKDKLATAEDFENIQVLLEEMETKLDELKQAYIQKQTQELKNNYTELLNGITIVLDDSVEFSNKKEVETRINDLRKLISEVKSEEEYDTKKTKLIAIQKEINQLYYDLSLSELQGELTLTKRAEDILTYDAAHPNDPVERILNGMKVILTKNVNSPIAKSTVEDLINHAIVNPDKFYGFIYDLATAYNNNTSALDLDPIKFAYSYFYENKKDFSDIAGGKDLFELFKASEAKTFLDVLHYYQYSTLSIEADIFENSEFYAFPEQLKFFRHAASLLTKMFKEEDSDTAIIFNGVAGAGKTGSVLKNLLLYHDLNINNDSNDKKKVIVATPIKNLVANLKQEYSDDKYNVTSFIHIDKSTIDSIINNLAKGDLLVIDELGRLPNEMYKSILKRAKEVGAKVILTGDPNQLTKIGNAVPAYTIGSVVNTYSTFDSDDFIKVTNLGVIRSTLRAEDPNVLLFQNMFLRENPMENQPVLTHSSNRDRGFVSVDSKAAVLDQLRNYIKAGANDIAIITTNDNLDYYSKLVASNGITGVKVISVHEAGGQTFDKVIMDVPLVPVSGNQIMHKKALYTVASRAKTGITLVRDITWTPFNQTNSILDIPNVSTTNEKIKLNKEVYLDSYIGMPIIQGSNTQTPITSTPPGQTPFIPPAPITAPEPTLDDEIEKEAKENLDAEIIEEVEEIPEDTSTQASPISTTPTGQIIYHPTNAGIKVYQERLKQNPNETIQVFGELGKVNGRDLLKFYIEDINGSFVEIGAREYTDPASLPINENDFHLTEPTLLPNVKILEATTSGLEYGDEPIFINTTEFTTLIESIYNVYGETPGSAANFTYKVVIPTNEELIEKIKSEDNFTTQLGYSYLKLNIPTKNGARVFYIPLERTRLDKVSGVTLAKDNDQNLTYDSNPVENLTKAYGYLQETGLYQYMLSGELINYDYTKPDGSVVTHTITKQQLILEALDLITITKNANNEFEVTFNEQRSKKIGNPKAEKLAKDLSSNTDQNYIRNLYGLKFFFISKKETPVVSGFDKTSLKNAPDSIVLEGTTTRTRTSTKQTVNGIEFEKVDIKNKDKYSHSVWRSGYVFTAKNGKDKYHMLFELEDDNNSPTQTKRPKITIWEIDNVDTPSRDWRIRASTEEKENNQVFSNNRYGLVQSATQNNENWLDAVNTILDNGLTTKGTSYFERSLLDVSKANKYLRVDDTIYFLRSKVARKNQIVTKYLSLSSLVDGSFNTKYTKVASQTPSSLMDSNGNYYEPNAASAYEILSELVVRKDRLFSNISLWEAKMTNIANGTNNPTEAQELGRQSFLNKVSTHATNFKESYLDLEETKILSTPVPQSSNKSNNKPTRNNRIGTPRLKPKKFSTTLSSALGQRAYASNVDVSEIKSYISRLFPDANNLKIELLTRIVMDSKYGTDVLGLYERGEIFLSESTPGTINEQLLRHELFHAIMDLYMTPQERKALYNTVATIGDYKRWVKQNNLTHNDIVAEEWLAREYQKYKLYNTSNDLISAVIRAIDRIILALKSLFSKNRREVLALFASIENKSFYDSRMQNDPTGRSMFSRDLDKILKSSDSRFTYSVHLKTLEYMRAIAGNLMDSYLVKIVDREDGSFISHIVKPSGIKSIYEEYGNTPGVEVSILQIKDNASLTQVIKETVETKIETLLFNLRANIEDALEETQTPETKAEIELNESLINRIETRKGITSSKFLEDFKGVFGNEVAFEFIPYVYLYGNQSYFKIAIEEAFSRPVNKSVEYDSPMVDNNEQNNLGESELLEDGYIETAEEEAAISGEEKALSGLEEVMYNSNTVDIFDKRVNKELQSFLSSVKIKDKKNNEEVEVFLNGKQVFYILLSKVFNKIPRGKSISETLASLEKEVKSLNNLDRTTKVIIDKIKGVYKSAEAFSKLKKRYGISRVDESTIKIGDKDYNLNNTQDLIALNAILGNDKNLDLLIRGLNAEVLIPMLQHTFLGATEEVPIIVGKRLSQNGSKISYTVFNPKATPVLDALKSAVTTIAILQHFNTNEGKSEIEYIIQNVVKNFLPEDRTRARSLLTDLRNLVAKSLADKQVSPDNQQSEEFITAFITKNLENAINKKVKTLASLQDATSSGMFRTAKGTKRHIAVIASYIFDIYKRLKYRNIGIDHADYITDGPGFQFNFFSKYQPVNQISLDAMEQKERGKSRAITHPNILGRAFYESRFIGPFVATIKKYLIPNSEVGTIAQGSESLISVPVWSYPQSNRQTAMGLEINIDDLRNLNNEAEKAGTTLFQKLIDDHNNAILAYRNSIKNKEDLKVFNEKQGLLDSEAKILAQFEKEYPTIRSLFGNDFNVIQSILSDDFESSVLKDNNPLIQNNVYTYLLSKGLVKELQVELVDGVIKDQKAMNNLLEEMFKEVFKFQWMSQYVLGAHYNMLLIGDQAHVKNNVTLIKRMQGVKSPGKPIQIIGDEFTTQTKVKPKQNIVVFKDIVHQIKPRTEQEKEMLENIIEDYDTTDAGSFARPSFLQQVIAGTGDRSLGNMLKLIGFGVGTDAMPLYLKTAVTVLDNEFTSINPMYGRILEFMEANDIDMLVPESALKLGLPKKSNQINLITGLGKTNEEIHVIEFPTHYLQVQSNPALDGTKQKFISDFTQLMYYIDVNTLNMKSALDIYNTVATIYKLNPKSKEYFTSPKLMKEFASSLNADYEHLKVLINELLENNEGGTINIDSPLISAEFTTQYLNFLWSKYAKITYAGTKHVLVPDVGTTLFEINGKYVTASDLSEESRRRITDLYRSENGAWLFELAKELHNIDLSTIATIQDLRNYAPNLSKEQTDETLENITLDQIKGQVEEIRINFNNPRRLNHMTEDGFAEIIAPLVNEKVLQEQGLTYNSATGAWEGLAVRFPTTGINSSLPVRIVGFVKSNAIIAPHEIVVRHGSDYDVDSLMFYTFDVLSDKEKDSLKSVGFTLDNSTPDYHVTEESIQDMINFYNKEEKDSGDLDRLKKLTKIKSTLEKVLKNYKIRKVIQVVTAPRNRKDLANKISFDPVEYNLRERLKNGEVVIDRILEKSIPKNESETENQYKARVKHIIEKLNEKDPKTIAELAMTQVGVASFVHIMPWLSGDTLNINSFETQRMFTEYNMTGTTGTGVQATSTKLISYLKYGTRYAQAIKEGETIVDSEIENDQTTPIPSDGKTFELTVKYGDKSIVLDGYKLNSVNGLKTYDHSSTTVNGYIDNTKAQVTSIFNAYEETYNLISDFVDMGLPIPAVSIMMQNIILRDKPTKDDFLTRNKEVIELVHQAGVALDNTIDFVELVKFNSEFSSYTEFLNSLPTITNENGATVLDKSKLSNQQLKQLNLLGNLVTSFNKLFGLRQSKLAVANSLGVLQKSNINIPSLFSSKEELEKAFSTWPDLKNIYEIPHIAELKKYTDLIPETLGSLSSSLSSSAIFAIEQAITNYGNSAILGNKRDSFQALYDHIQSYAMSNALYDYVDQIKESNSTNPLDIKLKERLKSLNFTYGSDGAYVTHVNTYKGNTISFRMSEAEAYRQTMLSYISDVIKDNKEEGSNEFLAQLDIKTTKVPRPRSLKSQANSREYVPLKTFDIFNTVSNYNNPEHTAKITLGYVDIVTKYPEFENVLLGLISLEGSSQTKRKFSKIIPQTPLKVQDQVISKGLIDLVKKSSNYTKALVSKDPDTLIKEIIVSHYVASNLTRMGVKGRYQSPTVVETELTTQQTSGTTTEEIVGRALTLKKRDHKTDGYEPIDGFVNMPLPIDGFAKREKLQESKESLSEQQTINGESLKNTLDYLSEKFGVPYNTSGDDFITIMNQMDISENNYPAGFVYQGQVYINTTGKGAQFGADTAFHEYAHFYINALKNANPVLYKTILKALQEDSRGQAILEQVQRLYPELDEADLLEEGLVTYIGLNAAELWDDKPTTFLGRMMSRLGLFVKKILRTLGFMQDTLLKDVVNHFMNYNGNLSMQQFDLKMSKATLTKLPNLGLTTNDSLTYYQDKQGRKFSRVSSVLLDFEPDAGKSKSNYTREYIIALKRFRKAGTNTSTGKINVKYPNATGEWIEKDMSFNEYMDFIKSKQETKRKYGKVFHYVADVINKNGVIPDLYGTKLTPLIESVNQKILAYGAKMGMNKTQVAEIVNSYSSLVLPFLTSLVGNKMTETTFSVNLTPKTQTIDDKEEIINGIAGTVDYIVQHDDGTITIIDYKTGALKEHESSHVKTMMRYSKKAGVDIQADSLSKAKMQVILQAFLVKASAKQKKQSSPMFRNLYLFHTSNDSNVRIEITKDLTDYLAILGEYFKNEHRDFYEENTELFSPLAYVSQETSFSKKIKEAKQDNLPHQKTTLFNEVLIGLENATATYGDDALNEGNKSKFLERINLLIQALSNKDLLNAGLLKAIDKITANATIFDIQDEVVRVFREFFIERKSKLDADLSKFREDSKSAIQKTGYTGTNPETFFNFMWVDDDLYGKSIVTYKSKEWALLNKDQRNYADYFRHKTRYHLFKTMNPQGGVRFINEELESRNDLSPEVRKELERQSNELASMPAFNKFKTNDQTLGFVYYEGYAPKVRMSQVKSRNMNLNSIKESITSFDPTEVELAVYANADKLDKIPFKYGAQITDSEDFNTNFSTNSEEILQLFISNMLEKEHYDDVFNFAYGLTVLYQNENAKTNTTKFNENIYFFRNFVRNVITKKRVVPSYLAKKVAGVPIDTWIRGATTTASIGTFGFQYVKQAWSVANQMLVNTREMVAGQLSTFVGIKYGATTASFARASLEASKMISPTKDSKAFMVARQFGLTISGSNFAAYDTHDLISKRNIRDVMLSTGFAVMKFGDDFNAAQYVFAQMMDMKHTHKGITKSVYDWYVVKNGELVWTGGIRGTDSETGEVITGLTGKEIFAMRELVRRTSGNYRPEEKIAVQSTSVGNALIQMKKWVPAVFADAWSPEKANGVLGAYVQQMELDENGHPTSIPMFDQEGNPIMRWDTTSSVGYISGSLTVATNIMKAMMTLNSDAIYHAWKDVTPAQKTALVRLLSTGLVLLASYYVFSFFRGAGDEDKEKDKSYLNSRSRIDMYLRNMQLELISGLLVTDLVNSSTNIVASDKVSSMFKGVAQLAMQERYQTGDRKGELKGLTTMKRSLPIFAAYYDGEEWMKALENYEKDIKRNNQ